MGFHISPRCNPYAARAREYGPVGQEVRAVNKAGKTGGRLEASASSALVFLISSVCPRVSGAKGYPGAQRRMRSRESDRLCEWALAATAQAEPTFTRRMNRDDLGCRRRTRCARSVRIARAATGEDREIAAARRRTKQYSPEVDRQRGEQLADRMPSRRPWRSGTT